MQIAYLNVQFSGVFILIVLHSLSQSILCFHHPPKSHLSISRNSLFFPNSLPASSTQPLIFLSLQICLIWTFHINTHTIYGHLCLASFINVFRFIQVVGCIGTSFLLMAEEYCIVWMHTTFLPTHQLVDIQIVFTHSTIMNSVIMNDHVQVFAWTCICIFLGHVPRTEIAGSWSYGISVFNILRNSPSLFLKWLQYFSLASNV